MGNSRRLGGLGIAAAVGVLVALVAIGVMMAISIGPEIQFYGQVELYGSDIGSDGRGGCVGLGPYADLHEDTRIHVDGENAGTRVSLSPGFRSTDGGCFFPFAGLLPAGGVSYTFDLGYAGKRTIAEADMSRPVLLVIGTRPAT
jgi:hypothetical protein